MAANFYGFLARSFGGRFYSAEHQENSRSAFYHFAGFDAGRALFQRAVSNRILLRISRLGTAYRRRSAFAAAHGASRRAFVFPDYRQYRRFDEFGRFCRNQLHHGADARRGDVSGRLGLRPSESDFIFQTRGKIAFFQARILVAAAALGARRFRARFLFRLFPRRQPAPEIFARRLDDFRRRIRFRLNLRRASSLYENRRAAKKFQLRTEM